jgi:membrane-associated phospholipid phosphatase
MALLIAYGMRPVFWAKRWWLRVAVVSAAALLTLAIGRNRLYLRVHYFSDVVGGAPVTPFFCLVGEPIGPADNEVASR